MKTRNIIIILTVIIAASCSNEIGNNQPKTIIYSGERAQLLGIDSIEITYSNDLIADSMLIYAKGELLQINRITKEVNIITFNSYNRRDNWEKDIWESKIDLNDKNQVSKFSMIRKDTLTYFDSLVYDTESKLIASYSVYVDIYKQTRLLKYVSKFEYDKNAEITKTVIFKLENSESIKVEELTYTRASQAPNFYYNNPYLYFLLDVELGKPMDGEYMSKHFANKITSSLKGDEKIEYEISNNKVIARKNNEGELRYKY